MARLLPFALTALVLVAAAGIFAGCTSNNAQQSESPGAGNATITNSSQLANTTNPFENSTTETPNSSVVPGP